MAGCLPDIEALAPDDLKGLVLQLLEDVVALKAENAALREEIARLKGLKGPPKLKPSGMEKATEPARAERKAGRRGGKIDRLVIDEEQVLKAAVPPGSRFKGYETYVVQELILRPHVIRYRRERWITPDGRTVVAALPAGTVGHFGPELRRFVLAQYHPGQVTVPRIVAQLRGLGMAISKRQVVRLLIAGKEDFLAAAGQESEVASYRHGSRRAALLGTDAKALAADRTLLGHFLETFVFQELRRQASWHDTPTEFFHFRDKDGVETDIVIEQTSGAVSGVEIKAAATVNSTDLRGLRKLEKAVGNRFVRGIVLYDGETSIPFGDRFHAVPMSRLWSML